MLLCCCVLFCMCKRMARLPLARRRRLIILIGLYMQLLLICIILQLRVIQLRLILLLEPDPRTNPRNNSYIRHINRTTFLSRVTKDDGPECLNQPRLNSHLFKKLCYLLVDQGGLAR
ncbi:hypothetical protein LINPERPRIM_LOCUS33312 [Linum perenne]